MRKTVCPHDLPDQLKQSYHLKPDLQQELIIKIIIIMIVLVFWEM